jgi:hypothetical protein
MMHDVANAYVAIVGLAAIGLATLGNERGRAVAPFLGLSGQPAWLYLAIETKMPGIVVLTLAYTAVWGMGCVRACRGSKKTNLDAPS